LQTYNIINEAIRRYFGKQTNKETKLRIRNITAKAALKFESEAWVLKKREKKCLVTAQMKFLRHLTRNKKNWIKKRINVLGEKREHRT